MRNLKGFPESMASLSQEDFTILQYGHIVTDENGRNIDEARLEWLAVNANTKKEVEYYKLFHGYILAGYPSL